MRQILLQNLDRTTVYTRLSFCFSRRNFRTSCSNFYPGAVCDFSTTDYFLHNIVLLIRVFKMPVFRVSAQFDYCGTIHLEFFFSIHLLHIPFRKTLMHYLMISEKDLPFESASMLRPQADVIFAVLFCHVVRLVRTVRNNSFDFMIVCYGVTEVPLLFDLSPSRCVRTWSPAFIVYNHRPRLQSPSRTMHC